MAEKARWIEPGGERMSSGCECWGVGRRELVCRGVGGEGRRSGAYDACVDQKRGRRSERVVNKLASK